MTADTTMSFVPKLEQRNLSDQCADHIVLMIANGELKAGQRLLEKEICRHLGVSRVPVREALRLLQAQGVVRTEPNRGSFIAEFGSIETAELLEVRLCVERLALKRLLDRLALDAEAADPLEEQITAMRRAAELNAQLAYCQADLAFHQKLIELSQSPLLGPIWTSLSRGVLVFLMQERDIAFDYGQSIDEHVFLLDVIRAGKPVAVDREIERHIMGYVHRHRQAVDTSAKVATK